MRRRVEYRAVWKTPLTTNKHHSLYYQFVCGLKHGRHLTPSSAALIPDKSQSRWRNPSTICSDSGAKEQVFEFYAYFRNTAYSHRIPSVCKKNKFMLSRRKKIELLFFIYIEKKINYCIRQNEYTFSSSFIIFIIIVIIIRVEWCKMARRDDTLLIKQRRRCKRGRGMKRPLYWHRSIDLSFDTVSGFN